MNEAILRASSVRNPRALSDDEATPFSRLFMEMISFPLPSRITADRRVHQGFFHIARGIGNESEESGYRSHGS
jgi:hypothetical protein